MRKIMKSQLVLLIMSISVIVHIEACVSMDDEPSIYLNQREITYRKILHWCYECKDDNISFFCDRCDNSTPNQNWLHKRELNFKKSCNECGDDDKGSYFCKTCDILVKDHSDKIYELMLKQWCNECLDDKSPSFCNRCSKIIFNEFVLTDKKEVNVGILCNYCWCGDLRDPYFCDQCNERGHTYAKFINIKKKKEDIARCFNRCLKTNYVDPTVCDICYDAGYIRPLDILKDT